MFPKWATLSFEEYRASRIADRLLKYVNSGDVALDCGCGSMRVARRVGRRSGATVLGMDVINLNRTALPMCLCPGERLAFANESVDVVLLITVLHHTSNAPEVLRECWRVARQKVIVLEDVYAGPAELSLLKVLDWLGNRSTSRDMSLPFTFRSEAEWKQIFSDLGMALMAVERIRPVPWRPSRHRLFVLDKQSGACQTSLK